MNAGAKVDPITEVEQIKPYKRRKKKPKAGTPADRGIRFDEKDVEVKVIEVPCPELEGPNADEYEVIGNLVDLVKHRQTQQVSTTPAAAGVFTRNQFDVSYIVGFAD
ncbi:MAG TPA: hypothetical protein EYQ14_12550 [Gammaproteobacteria bacterium]|nr:hypothetical protein [Gammaproteobacteria bacterium]